MATAPLIKRILFCMPADPHSRFVRLVLGEKGLPFGMKDPASSGQPMQDIPALQDENGVIVTYSSVIAEYLDEGYASQSLLGEGAAIRAQTRQVWRYVEGPVLERVTGPLLYEKVHRRLSGLGTPDSKVIQKANTAKSYYFKELERLIDLDKWLAGPVISLADLSLAAQLSLLDYMAVIDWNGYPTLADYYRRIKSRPSMRPLLVERLDGVQPSSTYADLDF